MNNRILKLAGIHAFATALYIVAVAVFLYYVPRAVAPSESVFIPITMLLLFVFSAAFTGVLVLGRPVLWYLDGKKNEAISMLVLTLGALFLITLVAFAILASLKR